MILINCDLGEWETLAETEWFMRRVDVVNVACGVHAGSALQLKKCRELADKFKVKIGMHPGMKAEMGRGDVSDLTPTDFINQLESQYQFFLKHAGIPEHIKLHGSLYHLSENNIEIRRQYLVFAQRHALEIVCLSAGSVYRDSIAAGLPVLAEAFLDRNYSNGGMLLPRSHPQALLKTADEASKRMSQLLNDGTLNSLDQSILTLPVDTVCIHSDSEISKTFLNLR